jgi:hypothetical protein
MPAGKSLLLKFTVAAAILVAMIPLLASIYYKSSAGAGCARCHEIAGNYKVWQASAHRSVACEKCHGDALTLDFAFHLNNANRVWLHLRGQVPEQIRIHFRDIPAIIERCRSCHQQEFAQWKTGPHSTPYSAIFLDEKHNTRRLLMDDCLRCHGMHFDGSISDLVTPVSTRGPWKLLRPEVADLPALPCLTCHEIHHKGEELGVNYRRTARLGVKQEIIRPSLGLLDRRTQQHVSLATMAVPVLREGDRLVKMSPDRRQALCYQCHAAHAGGQVNSGDDRTAVGVHEGLSCLACHQKHAMLSRASCATCHPRLSNCGLDVEKMDTTFSNPKSRHDIHRVKCIDCHPKGVPPKKPAITNRASLPAASASSR